MSELYSFFDKLANFFIENKSSFSGEVIFGSGPVIYVGKKAYLLHRVHTYEGEKFIDFENMETGEYHYYNSYSKVWKTCSSHNYTYYTAWLLADAPTIKRNCFKCGKDDVVYKDVEKEDIHDYRNRRCYMPYKKQHRMWYLPTILDVELAKESVIFTHKKSNEKFYFDYWEVYRLFGCSYIIKESGFVGVYKEIKTGYKKYKIDHCKTLLEKIDKIGIKEVESWFRYMDKFEVDD